MIARDHVIFVPLISPDAAAVVKLRAALEEIFAGSNTFSVEAGPINEIILHGQTELKLEQMVDQLRRGRGLDFKLGAPQVAYREAITRTIESEYTHAIRSKNQYAKVKIRFAPGEPGSGFRFDSKVRDDAVPPIFISAILKGLKEAAQRGPVAGFPVIDLSCTLLDGDYHEVDSTRDTFEIAARACLREALPKARPVILEPMMAVIVVTPQDYMGDVIGDLNSRRGQISGMENLPARQAISAVVPLVNLFGYISALSSMTQDRAECTMVFSHYQQVPPWSGGGDDPFAPAAALRG